MGDFKIYNGTTWVNPCDCNVHIRRTDNTWKLLDPASCPTRYWDGTQWCLIECTGAITSNTEINIWFDNSGSMAGTFGPLTDMIGGGTDPGALYSCLIQLYNNDPVLFSERVKVLNFNTVGTGFERFVGLLGTERNFQRATDTSVSKVINITFSDESDLYGYGANGTGPNAQLFYLNPFDNTQLNGGIPPGSTTIGTYAGDVTAVRAVQNDPSITYDIQGIAFHVASVFDDTSSGNACSYPRPDNVFPCPTCTITSTPSVCYGDNNQPTWPMFGELVKATFVDNGVYSGTNNLSEFYPNKYTYGQNLIQGETEEYYANIVVLKLNELGIPLTC